MQQLASDLLVREAKDPGQVAVVDAMGRHTLGEVLDAARELAAHLADAVDGAPTVLLQADNTWRTTAAAVAVGLRGGLVAVLSRHATAGEFALAVEDVRPDVVVAAPGSAETWAVASGAHSSSRVVLDGWELHARPGATAGVQRWAGGVAIAMTSGSTGRPKCVVQSEHALRYAASATIDAVGLRPGDAVAALVPLSSVAAFCFGLYLPAFLGGPQVCLEAWEPPAALDVMASSRWSRVPRGGCGPCGR
jgi:acyl-CoA synthetase (AMP-forming)/AMP-acid ligase II